MLNSLVFDKSCCKLIAPYKPWPVLCRTSQIKASVQHSVSISVRCGIHLIVHSSGHWQLNGLWTEVDQKNRWAPQNKEISNKWFVYKLFLYFLGFDIITQFKSTNPFC